jgi:hypothetical protein
LLFCHRLSLHLIEINQNIGHSLLEGQGESQAW